MMRRFSISTVTVIFLLLVSCKVPPSRESFCKHPDRNGCYNFVLEFTDTTAFYDLYLCTCFDCMDARMVAIGTLPVEISAVSPEGRRYSEKVYFPLDAPVRATYNVKEYISLYRSKVSGTGTWNFSIKPLEPGRLVRGFRGFGIQMKMRNGER